MRFLVIGCGSIGRRHIGNLLALGHEVAAYNRGAARREAAARQFGIAVFADLDDLLAGGGDAAVIATPNSLHLAHALAAARAGLDLFIEKPLSHALDGLDELAAEVGRRGLITHVGSNLRWHFGPRTVKDLVDRGAVGRVLWAHFYGGMHLPDWHPDEDYRQMYSARQDLGGGAVLDFIHELDLVLWFFGPPARLAAMTGHSGWLEIETEDIADILLGYDTGLQVNLHLDYLQKPYQRGLRVVGDRGWAAWDLAREAATVFRYDRGDLTDHPHPAEYGPNTMYVEQMKYFIRCLEERIPSVSDLDVGRRALELALRVRRSNRENTFWTGK